ncbi:MAG: hypothetical protein AMS17_12835 [Spirochaetes bacterium DG_61]|nr:MAG: hypothetical protein AMS17_12835 [Spirochaetes bacterium DG_61]
MYWKKRNNKYKTGKFCHIYRIRATDSYGIWTWCKQQVVGKEWIITIPINFWQNAVYPIVIDPMIGWSGGGASCLPAKDRLNGTVYTAPAETGNITKWHFSICQVDETDKRMKAGIAETDENGNPSYQNVVEQIEMDPIEVSSDFQWDGQGGEIVGEEEYYLTFDCPNSNNRLTLDGGGNKYWYKAVIPYDTAIPDPLPEIYQSQQYQVGIWVDYEVPPAPEISFTPSSFNFEANEGEGNPSNQILEIWNSGAGTLNWNVDDDADWLVENPKSGESTGEYDEVTVSVDITGLEAGVYNATITITAPGASNTPQTIPVQLTINPAAEFIEVIEGDSIITKQIDGDSTITKIIDEKSAITKLIDEESPLNG